MSRRPPYRIPASSALVAFESAARLGNFSRAAEEVCTSQSAVSRHISNLEQRLSTRLFDRSRSGVRLTEAGRRLHDSVAAGLALIEEGCEETTKLSDFEEVVIACSHEMSQFVVMPRYDALQEALGEQIQIRVLTYHRDHQNLPVDTIADVLITSDVGAGAPEDRVVAFKEEVRPVCSPGYASAHVDILKGPVEGWGGVTFLAFTEALGRWSSWDDWFDVAGRPRPAPKLTKLDSYAYALEAAAAGHGIALGWRHFIEGYFKSGALVPLADGFAELGGHSFAVLTTSGRGKPVARECLEFFGRSV